MTTLRIGTRGSALATSQAGDVARAIESALGIETELVLVTTHGDTSRESLSQMGGTGVFASALREELLAGACDLVVHSMKDLPTAPYPGLVLASSPERADARDTLCARDGLRFAELPPGARVGTGSPRRAAQLARLRPDLDIRDIRGNVGTRLGFVTSGELDAVVLAAAGLERLGLQDVITDYFPLETWPTAAAQGALGIEVRAGDEQGDGLVARAIAAVNRASTMMAATAERAVLARLEAGCHAPIAASAVFDEDGELELTAIVFALDGSAAVESTIRTAVPADVFAFDSSPDYYAENGPELLRTAERVGFEAADALLEGGAADIATLG